MVKSKIIVANRFDGMGERLIAILNAIYLAKICQLDFKFVWNAMDEYNENVGKGYDFIFPSVPTKEYMFEESFIEKFFFYNYQTTYFDHELWYHKNENIKNIIKGLLVDKNIIQCNLAVRIDTYFRDINSLVYRRQMYEIWNNIPFSKDIKEAIYYAKNKAKELGSYSTIHIRGGDIVYRSDILYLLTPNALPVHLAIEIIKLCGGKLVILGNDNYINRELKMMFNGKFGDIFTSEDFFKEKKFNAHQKAIFDIILMSESKKLYFSGASGFSVLSYLIGSCEAIYIYDKYSTTEQYLIIKENMKNYQFNLYHQAFSCMYLYKCAKELELPLCIQLEILKEAMELRDDAFIFKVLFIDTLLKQKMYLEAERWILNSIINKMELFFKDLLYETWGVRGDYLYFFTFVNYFNIENCENYPILFNIAIVISYELIKINSRIVENEMKRFLLKNVGNFELIENCKLIENKQEVLKTLLAYLCKILIETKGGGGELCLTSFSAVSHVKNHLSFRLGEAMIFNSKSIWGFIRMPYVLSYIYDKYRQEQKLLSLKRLDKNSKITIPLNSYDDYSKSPKLKESLTYKLGETLISGHKIWYKGGYIWTLFRILKLIKEYNANKKKG